jgi:hypothetical protein
MRMFPIQRQRGAKPHPLSIPWSLAELAYSVYSSRYGSSQSLERLAERGGFGPGEMDEFVPDWRERCSEVSRLRSALERAESFIIIMHGDPNGVVPETVRSILADIQAALEGNCP